MLARSLRDGILTLGVIGALGFAGPARAEVDPSFGIDGTASVSVVDANAGTDAVSIDVQPDGRILVATREGAGDFAVFRFMTDGALDSGFGAGGKQTLDLGGDDVPTAVLVQPDGRILLAGISTLAGQGRLGLVRLLADGSLDPEFAAGGILIDNFDVHTTPQALALTATGEIIVAGEIRFCCPGGFPGVGAFLARLDSSGALDPSFANGGVWSRPGDMGSGQVRTGLAFYAVEVQSDGRIVAAGMDYTYLTDDPATSGNWTVHRFLDDGTHDPGFGTQGVAHVWLPYDASEPFGSTYDAREVLLLANGDMLVAGGRGLAGFSGGYSLAAARLSAQGTLDATWGVDGRVETLPYPRPPFWPLLSDPARVWSDGALLRSDGSFFLVARGMSDVTGPNASAVVLRHLPDGSLDPSWSDDGILELPGSSKRITVDAALESDDELLVVTRSDGNVEVRRVLGYHPCGNGTVEPWEDCDDTNTEDGDCCSATCQFEPAGSSCPDDGNGCTADACDAQGGCTHTPRADGEICEDGELCTHSDVCSSGVCVGNDAPAFGCRLAQSGSLTIRRSGGTRDLLSWVWKKGAATEISEIPAQPYSLCLYEGGGTSLVASFDVPGLPCDADHCFKTSPRKTSYLSRSRAYDGVRKMTLGAGVSGKAQARLKAQGSDAPVPALPLVEPVIAQFHAENGVCFESSYSDSKRNSDALYKARAD